MSDVGFFLGSALLVVLGLFMLIAPGRYHAFRLRRFDEDIADRQARGTDAYFEELRTLQAYRRPPPGIRFLGALALLLGGGVLILRLTGAGR